MVNIDPPEDLPDYHTTDYRSAYRECIVPKFSEFEEEVDEYRDDLEDFIEQEREHRRLINYCIFPFSQSDSLEGFRFVRADPLEELDLPNFEFLLHDLEGRVIVGEAKATLPTNVKSEMNDIREQINYFKFMREYIEDEYLGREIVHVEFVLATYQDYASKAARTILENGENIVTWRVNRFTDTLNIEKELPDEMPDNINADSLSEGLQELRRRCLHDIPQLNSSLEGYSTATGSVNVFPRSALVDKLRVIVRQYESEGRYAFVCYEDIKREVKNGAMNYGEARIDEITEQIIQEGIKIGILEDWEKDLGDYKVVSQYTSREGIEQTLTKKWIQNRIEEEKESLREDCREYARQKAGEQAQLDDFED